MKTEAERRATREARFGISVPVVVTTGPKSAPMGAINVKPKIAGPVTITQLNYSVCALFVDWVVLGGGKGENGGERGEICGTG